MPNFTLSEILTIAVVILIVFGPQRLPEMAQKAGALIRKGRTMVDDLRREFDVEIREVTEPLKEVREELKGVREDMSTSVSSLAEEVQQAKKGIEGQLEETNKEVSDAVTGGEDDDSKPVGNETKTNEGGGTGTDTEDGA
jgi:sec-independent protein translocase protein TatB